MHVHSDGISYPVKKFRRTFLHDRRRYTLERMDGRWVVSHHGEQEVVAEAKPADDLENDWQLRVMLIRRYQAMVQERLRARAVPGSR